MSFENKGTSIIHSTNIAHGVPIALRNASGHHDTSIDPTKSLPTQSLQVRYGTRLLQQ